MAEPQILFEDAAAYERMMGVWSRIAGGAGRITGVGKANAVKGRVPG
jgi:hypothetical protein